MPGTTKKNINNWFIDDTAFHYLYPPEIQKMAENHWTPIEVSKCAADFLVTEKGSKVLDIGCGVGKFVLAAAHYKPNAIFYGIEQREELLEYATDAQARLDLKNVSFIHGNFTQLDFKKFDNFYFFNSFYENLEGIAKIDHKIQYSLSLYNNYNKYLYNQLKKMPVGTRIATYHTREDQIPPSYYIVKTQFDKLLNFLIKV